MKRGDGLDFLQQPKILTYPRALRLFARAGVLALSLVGTVIICLYATNECHRTGLLLLSRTASEVVHFFTRPFHFLREMGSKADFLEHLCPQEDWLLPTKRHGLWQELSTQVNTPDFKNQIVKWLSGAVKIP